MRLLPRSTAAALALSLSAASFAAVSLSVTTAPAAGAAETIATTTSFNPEIVTRGRAGGYWSVNGAVRTPEDTGPLAGTAELQRLAPGATTWKTVGADDSPGYAYYPDTDSFTTNAKFRIYYTGGTYSPGTSSERTYAPSVSKVISVKVERIFEVDNVAGKRQPTADVKVTPKFGKKKLLVQKKVKGKKGFRTFKKARTNKFGKVRLSLAGSRKGIRYRLVAPKDKKFVTTSTIVRAVRYRPVAG